MNISEHLSPIAILRKPFLDLETRCMVWTFNAWCSMLHVPCDSILLVWESASAVNKKHFSFSMFYWK